MTTVSGTFTGKGVSSVLSFGNTPENVDFSITGPFDGTVQLERSLTPDQAAWEPVAGPYKDKASTVSGRYTTRPNERLRLRVTAGDLTVTNGSFSTDTGWTKGTGWTIDAANSNKAESDGSQAGASLLSQTLSGMVPGATYVVTFTTTRSAGTVTLTVGGTAGTARSTADTFVETIVAGSSDSLLAFSADADFVGSIDTVSITPSFAYSFSDTNATVAEEKDADGNVILRRTQAGVEVPGTLAVTGAVSASAGVTAPLTGAVNSSPIAETQSVDPSQKATYYDDFLGDVIRDEWTAITGTDPQAVAAVVVAGTANGMIRITSGDSNPGVTAADAAGIVLGRNWKASQGGLVLEARVKIDDISTVRAFVGFTDTIALEFPGVFSSATFVAAADDAVGFLFDTVGSAPDEWFGVGVKATAVGARQSSGVAPVNDTYDILRVEVDTSGTATYYINGTSVGSLANAVTAATLLTPVLIVMEAGVGVVRKLDVDYVWVQQNR